MPDTFYDFTKYVGLLNKLYQIYFIPRHEKFNFEFLNQVPRLSLTFKGKLNTFYGFLKDL